MDKGGAPWQNGDFVETIQNQAQRIDTSFIKAISQNSDGNGNTGIIMSGIAISQNSTSTTLTFNKPLVYLNGDFRVDNLTGSITYNSPAVWIVQGSGNDDVRTFRDGRPHTFSTELIFSVTTIEPDDTAYIEINFQNGCSRLWKDIVSNACAKTGEIKQVAILSSNIDFTTGRGKNEWFGWAVADGRSGTVNMNGRVALGYTNGDSQLPIVAPNKTQTNYGKIGNTGGLANVQLTNDESGLPLHTHNSTTVQTTAGSYIQSYTSGTGINLIVSPQQTQFAGGLYALEVHENRQPYTVVLYMQKLPS